MLVLSRKVGEIIHIGNDIEVTVVSVDGDTVKLGIIAPKNIPIHRKEVYEEIRQENQASLFTKDQLKKLKKLKK